jgi:hypothetical protein
LNLPLLSSLLFSSLLYSTLSALLSLHNFLLSRKSAPISCGASEVSLKRRKCRTFLGTAKELRAKEKEDEIEV